MSKNTTNSIYTAIPIAVLLGLTVYKLADMITDVVDTVQQQEQDEEDELQGDAQRAVVAATNAQAWLQRAQDASNAAAQSLREAKWFNEHASADSQYAQCQIEAMAAFTAFHQTLDVTNAAIVASQDAQNSASNNNTYGVNDAIARAEISAEQAAVSGQAAVDHAAAAEQAKLAAEARYEQEQEWRRQGGSGSSHDQW
jgi:hypothetical protein